MSFKNGSLVKVTSQPKNLLPLAVGAKGMVKESLDDYVFFEALRPNGSMVTLGWIPESCLEKDDSEELKKIAEKRVELLRKDFTDSQKRIEKITEGIEEIAKKYKITNVQVREICDAMNCLVRLQG